MKRAWLIAAALLALSGCGLKGDPLPPITPTPEKPAKQNARAREGCVELRWRAPKADAPERCPAAYWEVLRADDPDDSGLLVYRVLATVESTSYSDCPGRGGGARAYSIRGVCADGERGKSGPVIRVSGLSAPGAPSAVRVEAGDGFVDLTWQGAKDLPPNAGFNVYRSQDPDDFPWRPLNSTPIRGDSYTDGPLPNGVSYYYQVRAVALDDNALPVEGPASLVSRAAPVDLVPPAPPEGLAAVWTEEGVLLKWFSNDEPDLAGYRVYRRRRGRGSYQPLFAKPIADTTYLDASTTTRIEYQYVVRALDNASSPNQSPPSNDAIVYAQP